jgi:DnaJ-class molecular chaperone
MSKMVECTLCDGTGQALTIVCPRCEGIGRVAERSQRVLPLESTQPVYFRGALIRNRNVKRK